MLNVNVSRIEEPFFTPKFQGAIASFFRETVQSLQFQNRAWALPACGFSISALQEKYNRNVLNYSSTFCNKFVTELASQS